MEQVFKIIMRSVIAKEHHLLTIPLITYGVWKTNLTLIVEILL